MNFLIFSRELRLQAKTIVAAEALHQAISAAKCDRFLRLIFAILLTLTFTQLREVQELDPLLQLTIVVRRRTTGPETVQLIIDGLHEVATLVAETLSWDIKGGARRAGKETTRLVMDAVVATTKQRTQTTTLICLAKRIIFLVEGRTIDVLTGDPTIIATTAVVTIPGDTTSTVTTIIIGETMGIGIEMKTMNTSKRSGSGEI